LKLSFIGNDIDNLVLGYIIVSVITEEYKLADVLTDMG
jgi:uncharacterized protein YebE (UPF0316 family)